MGLRQQLAALALETTHVLVIETPGAWRTRVTIEREAEVRGWRLAGSAADADALVIAGRPEPQLSERIETVWDQLPGPRSRAVVADHDAATVRAALEAVAAELLDTDRQTRDARERDGFDPMSMNDADDPESHLQAGQDSDDDMDMSGDMDMDMSGDMDMEMSPSGIPLAEGGPDRDGLEMDVLHVPLGPVLSHWPAGLVLRCALQGDVIIEAEASVLDGPHGGFPRPSPAERAAQRCDQVADVLALAGSARTHSMAVDARDALLDHPEGADGATLLADLRRRLGRARLLRWSLRGIGELRSGQDGIEVPPHLCGDAAIRLLNLADRARAELAGDTLPEVALPDVLATVERLVVGLDLAAARLVIASLAIDTAPLGIPAGRVRPGVRDA